MSSNGITAKEACEITKNSEKPDFVKRELKAIDELIKIKAKDADKSALVSFLKRDINDNDLKLIIQNLTDRGFKVESGDVVDWSASHSLIISWC